MVKLMLAELVSLSITAAMMQQVASHAGVKSADEIVATVQRTEESQRTRLSSYTVVRKYTVKNDHLKGDAILEVLWNYQPGKGKTFKVISNQGASGLTRRSLMKVLEAEAKNSRLKKDPSRISPDHYRFDLAGNGEDDYRLRLTPRKKSKYLLDGYAVVSKQDPAIVRVEGRTSKRLSFWVSEADVVQEFSNRDGFWLPHKTYSRAHIRFVGRTELTIEADSYRFLGSSTGGQQ